MHDDMRSFVTKSDFSRREFVVTTLATGFALAVQPVSAETITTDTKGIEAGEIKIPTPDGEMPAYRAMPEGKAHSPWCWWCRKSSASTSTSRTSAAGWPSPATWPWRRSCTRGRGTSPA